MKMADLDADPIVAAQAGDRRAMEELLAPRPARCRRHECMSAQEAAEVVGIEVGALRSRLHRARMALRTN